MIRFSISPARHIAVVSILMSIAFLDPAIAQDESAEAIGTAVGGVIGILLVIVIGAVIGWLAGLIVKGHGSGLLGNVAAGVGGSILASYGLSAAGLTFGTVGSFVAAIVGAVVLILIVRLIRKAAN